MELILFRFTDAVRRQLKAHQAPFANIDKTYRRNAFLAMVELSFVFGEASPSKETFFRVTNAHDRGFTSVSGRVFYLYCYICRYGHTPSAFSDVKSYVEKLAYEEQVKLLYIMGTSIQNNTEISVSIINSDNEIEIPVEPIDVSFLLHKSGAICKMYL